MATRSLPAWAHEYLLRDSWTEQVLLDLLCGRNPEAVASSRQEFLDWARERASMAERVEEAVVEGTLKVRRVQQHDLLDKVAKLDEALAKELRKETAPYLIYGKRFFVTPRAAIEWATRTPGRFPSFPFSLVDLDAATTKGSSRSSSDFTWQSVKIRFTSDHEVQLRCVFPNVFVPVDRRIWRLPSPRYADIIEPFRYSSQEGAWLAVCGGVLGLDRVRSSPPEDQGEGRRR